MPFAAFLGAAAGLFLVAALAFAEDFAEALALAFAEDFAEALALAFAEDFWPLQQPWHRPCLGGGLHSSAAPFA